MNIVALFLQGEGGGGSSLLGWLPILLIPIIFYFILFRPQRQQQQQLQEMIASLKINDEVVTNGGVIGKIKEVRETSFIILSADKTFLEIGKSAVVGKKAESK
ncbi:MAG TPA: preprotein translocase subunit YajC [Pyrinomonadaceae bacterium]|jgi:preprotein translocase subunit YajC